VTHIPLVSVVMPLYNKRPYVKRAIDSVRQQTFTDWELIIVDDGCTDGSSAEIPEDDPRIRLFRQPNSGPGAARNHGIKLARGELVTFIDADDYYYPQKLEEEMSLLFKERKAEWMISAFDRQEDNHIRHCKYCDINGRELQAQTLVLDNALNQISLQGMPIDGLCIKKHLLDRLGGFNEEMRCYEITEFIIRCALKQPKVLVHPTPLYCVVNVDDSAFAVSSHRILGMRQFGESLLHLCKDYPESSHLLKPKSRKIFISYATALIRTGKGREARRFLTKKFPYEWDKIWWKLWIISWLSGWLLKRRVYASTN